MLPSEMRSPFTGGEARELWTTETYTMRRQEFAVTAPCWQCVDTGEQFTTDTQDEIFLSELNRLWFERTGTEAYPPAAA